MITYCCLNRKYMRHVKTNITVLITFNNNSNNTEMVSNQQPILKCELKLSCLYVKTFVVVTSYLIIMQYHARHC